MANHLLRIAILLSCSNQASAQECFSPMYASFKGKIKEFQFFKERNLEQRAALEGRLATCLAEGTLVSSKLADAAQALTCQAAKDASSLDRQMKELAQECKGIFEKIDALQRELKGNFEVTKGDIDAAGKILEGSRDVQRACPEPVRLTLKMVKGFAALHEDIVAVKAKATASVADYGKFEAAAQQLHQLTLATSKRCGNDSFPADYIRPAPSQMVAAGGPIAKPPVPGGNSPRSNSQITGKIERLSLESLPGKGENGLSRAQAKVIPRTQSASEVTKGVAAPRAQLAGVEMSAPPSLKLAAPDSPSRALASLEPGMAIATAVPIAKSPGPESANSADGRAPKDKMEKRIAMSAEAAEAGSASEPEPARREVTVDSTDSFAQGLTSPRDQDVPQGAEAATPGPVASLPFDSKVRFLGEMPDSEEKEEASLFERVSKKYRASALAIPPAARVAGGSR